jgi:hypothetical protein
VGARSLTFAVMDRGEENAAEKRGEDANGAGEGPRRLLPGDALFQKVRMQQTGELDGEAVIDVAHHPS